MQRTEDEKLAAIAEAKELIRIAGGPRQMALKLFYPPNAIADTVTKERVRLVSQWKNRGIPTHIQVKHNCVFDALRGIHHD